MLKQLITVSLLSLIIVNAYSQQLAFPSAEGYGKYTVGGRGGDVYEVTNLNDKGEGSLRAAVDAEGARTVVFTVSGNIELESQLNIKNPYITIAGQTAPGDGICLKNHPLIIDANQVIVRHLRVRPGDLSGKEHDAISSRYVKNIILDHVSASWSVDECMSIYRVDSLTVQWCIISESMFLSNHKKGNHGFGGIWGGNYASYHHNLIAHHASRNPRWASGVGFTDYRNNVIFNWGYNSCYGGNNRDKKPQFHFFSVNMVANYYKPGPATAPGKVSYRIANPYFNVGDTATYAQWYIEDNFMEGNPTVTSNNWQGVHTKNDSICLNELKQEKPWPSMPINQQSATGAFDLVLKNAGAVLPKRDGVDSRIVTETKTGIASYEGSGYKERKEMADKSLNSGIIDSQSDVGAWPELKSEPAPKDLDHDGMPDYWEQKNKLDHKNPDDRNTITKDGYTMLEVYLNGIK